MDYWVPVDRVPMHSRQIVHRTVLEVNFTKSMSGIVQHGSPAYACLGQGFPPTVYSLGGLIFFFFLSPIISIWRIWVFEEKKLKIMLFSAFSPIF